MIDNFICQTVASNGNAATIYLENAVTGFGKFSDAFTTDTVVYYTLIDGNNKETGVGEYNPTNETLTRTKAFTAIVGGTYRKEPVTFISYSNTAIVASMNSVEALLHKKVSWVKENLPLQVFTTMGGTVKGFVAPTLTRQDDFLTGQYFLPNNIVEGSEAYIELLLKTEASANNQVSLVTEYIAAIPATALSLVHRETTRHLFTEGQSNAPELVRIPLTGVGVRNASVAFNIYRDFQDGLDTVNSTLTILGSRIVYQINRVSSLEVDD